MLPMTLPIGFCDCVGNSNQHLACRLLVVPAALDRGEFRRLVVVHDVAGEMSEIDLHGQQNCGEEQAHAKHDVRLGGMNPAQQVPGAGGGDAERAGQKRTQQHVGETNPHD
jgi:hypothetical protein